MSESALVVSHESDGRALDAPPGVSPDELVEALDRHVPDEPDPDPAAAPAPEKQTRGQKRFSELTSERNTAREEAAAERTKREAAEKRIAELEARVQHASTPQQAQQATQQLQQAQQQEQTRREEPKKFTFPDFDAWLTENPQGSWNDWDNARLDARDAWRDQQTNLDARIRSSIEADRASRSAVERKLAVGERARKAFSDFDALLTQGPGVPFANQIPPDRMAYIDTQPHAEHVLYAMLKDAALAQQLAFASPFEFGVAVSRLAPATSDARPASSDRVGSATPPAPYQPVGSGSKTTSPSSADLADSAGEDFDKSGYREKRAAERGRTRRP